MSTTASSRKLVWRSQFVCWISLIALATSTAAESPAEPNVGAERVEIEKYPSGAIREKTIYRDGKCAESTWYRPDGTVLDTTDFAKNKTGWSYRLRDDGSIRMMCQCDYNRACGEEILVHGMAIFMNPAQTESMVLYFEDGVCTDPKRYEQAFKMAVLDGKDR